LTVKDLRVYVCVCVREREGGRRKKACTHKTHLKTLSFSHTQTHTDAGALTKCVGGDLGSFAPPIQAS